MLKENNLQFAVVREDPELELGLFKKHHVKRPILIGSGGCTALAIASRFPDMSIALIEPNPAQMDLIRAKIRTVSKAPKVFMRLIEKGNFETLFRGLRSFIYEFILEKEEMERLLLKGTDHEWQKVFAHKYWPVAFDLFLSNSLLLTMFGPEAIQHAPAESYSRYFQTVFEKGLLRKDRSQNYFLFHLLLGSYPKKRTAWPVFLQRPPKKVRIEPYQMMAHQVPSYEAYDFVGLSNIFDWSSKNEIKNIASKLSKELKPGALVLYRQLNNSKDFESLFGNKFEWLPEEAERLHRRDRSLFYSSLHLARKLK